MRTVRIYAPATVVKRAAEGLSDARFSGVFGGTAVQSPDFEEMHSFELKAWVRALEECGIRAELLENDEPIPPAEGSEG